jgi:cell division protein FtsW (lipid II flippase)
MEGLMQIGFRLLDRIAATHTGAVVLAYIEHLSAAEIKILVAVGAVLILFLVWRWFGFIMVLVMLLFYLLAYVLFINDISDLYKDYQTKNIQHLQTIEKELEIK